MTYGLSSSYFNKFFAVCLTSINVALCEGREIVKDPFSKMVFAINGNRIIRKLCLTKKYNSKLLSQIRSQMREDVRTI